jgi:hypothetical protein
MTELEALKLILERAINAKPSDDDPQVERSQERGLYIAATEKSACRWVDSARGHQQFQALSS